MDFFKKTFYAYQFGDMKLLEKIIDKVIELLKAYTFLERSDAEYDDFVSANVSVEDTLKATPLGEKVSELYLDPYTAHHILEAFEQTKQKRVKDINIGLLQALSDTIEMEPLLPVRSADVESLHTVLSSFEDSLLVPVPSEYDFSFDDFLRTIKTALFFKAWIDETDEELLLERFSIRPGETRAKLENIDWLIRCSLELARFNHERELISVLVKLQKRLNYGVKEELLPLLRLKGIGRVRARKLFDAGYTSLSDLKPESQKKITDLIGEKLTQNIFDQLGHSMKSNDLTDFI